LQLVNVYPDVAAQVAIELQKAPEEIELVRKFYTVQEKDRQIIEGERAVISIINTAAVDRDKEIVDPKGALLKDYRSAPVVLWAHRYGQPPIGKNVWIKYDRARNALVAKTVFAQTEFADEIYRLYKDGFIFAWSIGFIPTVFKELDEKEREKLRGYILKWHMLEYSAVPVPSNPEALTIDKAVEIGVKSQTLLVDLNLKEEEDGPEDKGEELKGESLKALVRVACAFFNAGDIESKQAAKEEVDVRQPDFIELPVSVRGIPPEENCPLSEGTLVTLRTGPNGEEFLYEYSWTLKDGEFAADYTGDLHEESGETSPVDSETRQLAAEWVCEVLNDFTWTAEDIEVELDLGSGETSGDEKGSFDGSGENVVYVARSPEEFVPETFKTVLLQREPRVFAVMGKLLSEEEGSTKLATQSVQFPKEDGWDLEKAKSWVKENEGVFKAFEALPEVAIKVLLTTVDHLTEEVAKAREAAGDAPGAIVIDVEGGKSQEDAPSLKTIWEGMLRLSMRLSALEEGNTSGGSNGKSLELEIDRVDAEEIMQKLFSTFEERLRKAQGKVD
jgi:hypothetical protein